MRNLAHPFLLTSAWLAIGACMCEAHAQAVNDDDLGVKITHVDLEDLPEDQPDPDLEPYAIGGTTATAVVVATTAEDGTAAGDGEDNGDAPPPLVTAPADGEEDEPIVDDESDTTDAPASPDA